MDLELPTNAERVRENTRATHNRQIREDFERRLRHLARHREEIPQRLAELDREWDIERTLEANAATLALTGTLLSILDRRFLVLPAVVTGFLLQHALQGWCPPLNLFRRFGRRTQTEIEAERYALKALRGDFEPLDETAGHGSGNGSSHFSPAEVEHVLSIVAAQLPART